MNMLAIILVIGVVIGVVIGGIFVVSHLQDKKRTEKLRQIADEMGLPFYPQGDGPLIGQLSNFPLFSEGRSKKIKNMLHGDEPPKDGILSRTLFTVAEKPGHSDEAARRR